MKPKQVTKHIADLRASIDSDDPAAEKVGKEAALALLEGALFNIARIAQALDKPT